jgi:hypothetical protein
VKNAEAVLAQLPVFLAGWPFAWDRPAGDEPCEIEVREAPGAITITRRGAGGNTQSFATALDAANGLAGALVSALIARDAETICLHAAAAVVGEGLALFIGESEAGKSSVALNLAVRGHMLFGDDRIGVRFGVPPTGICLGLMPKARLPLPPTADHRFAAFVEAFSALQTEDIAYLRPPAGAIGEFGDERPLAAIFLLERRATGKTRLAPAPRPDIVAAVVRHGFAPHIPAGALIGRAAALATAVPGHRLTFSDSRDAAQVAAATAGAGAA